MLAMRCDVSYACFSPSLTSCTGLQKADVTLRTRRGIVQWGYMSHVKIGCGVCYVTEQQILASQAPNQ